MLDIKIIREAPEALRECLAQRVHQGVDVDEILARDEDRRKLLYEVEQLRAHQNKVSEEISQKKRRKEDAGDAIAAMKEVGARIKGMNDELKSVEEALHDLLMGIPNFLDESVPEGADESANRIEREWGEAPAFGFEVKDHVDIGEELGILDFETAAKLSGARFSLSKGPGALLERALINFMLDTHTREHGYMEVVPPFAVTAETLRGTGQLPKFAEELFRLEGRDLWLIPTAEVPMTNMHKGEILDGDRLPLRYTACTPCFRSEAGSHGADTRGMLRLHQFNKVEMVIFTKPEHSFEELESLTANAESILQRLGLHYRVVTLSSGDTGFAAAKTYDIEVWLPGQGKFREISSCSNCTDFQARRANIRFRANGKPAFVHTLNGSGLAVGRTVIAILENYQQADGSVVIPEVLRPFMHGSERIEAN